MAFPIVTLKMVQEAYPKRPSEVKKYDYGFLLSIGGSEMYTGAPALVGLAALRAGVDLVRVVAPRRAADIISSFTPVLVTYPLDGQYLQKKDLATLFTMTQSGEEVSHGNMAIAIGGGLGRAPEVQQVVRNYLREIDTPVVIDADAIHAVAAEPEILQGKPFLLTPNTHEFTVLTGREVRELSHEERIQVVREEAARLQTTILLKVKTDIISDGERVLLNETGSPYLSIAGAGETLAGIAGALLARNISPFEAGGIAAYINGKAGELASREMKESLIATDLIDAIPEVLS